MSFAPLSLIKSMRPKQWTKNIVVLAAYVFAWGDREQGLAAGAIWPALGAALLFCAVSSAVYLFNDIHDLPYDRMHPKKKLRPLASGAITIVQAAGLAVLLALAGLGLAWKLAPGLAGVLLAYLALQILYTLLLKNIALVDLFVIAFGFVLRALAGVVTLHVTISPWLLLCTLLLALFLALCKRRHEKVVLEPAVAGTRANLDQYDEKLLDQLISIVSAATLVCYSIYTLWPDTIRKFGTSLMSLTIPFVAFGLFRYLDLVYRHEKGDRPEQILLSDIPLLADILLYGATVLAVLFAGR